MKPDLHMHTTASDGGLSPRELVDFAASRGVTIMAITDHDTFDGADSLRGADTPIPVITGVELSMKDMKGLHLLGYGLGELGPLGLTMSLGFASGAMLYVVFGEILPQSILMYHSKMPAFSAIVGILVGLLIIF